MGGQHHQVGALMPDYVFDDSAGLSDFDKYVYL